MRKPTSDQTLTRPGRASPTAPKVGSLRKAAAVVAPPAKRGGKQPKDSDLTKRIAERLKAARMAFDENQASVAKRLGVSPQVLSAAETGRNYPDAMMLIRFCLISECTTDWLFLGRMESSMPPKMAARIGALFPHLLEEDEEMEKVTAAA